MLIAQVHYDTPGSDAEREFVDLYNPTAAAVSLDGWALGDNWESWKSPSGVIVGAGAYLSVARSLTGFAGYYGKDADVGGLATALGNNGDRLRLLDETGAVVDHCAWEGVDGWGISAATGTSIERLDLGADTDTDRDWGLTTPAEPRD